MAQWLQQVSQWQEMYCHDLEVMSSNPGWVELGVRSTSVLSRTTWTTDMHSNSVQESGPVSLTISQSSICFPFIIHLWSALVNTVIELWRQYSTKTPPRGVFEGSIWVAQLFAHILCVCETELHITLHVSQQLMYWDTFKQDNYSTVGEDGDVGSARYKMAQWHYFPHARP